MSDTARWNLIVSRRTDDALRQFLAGRGRGQKGELSRFVEEAVRARILELAAEDAKRQNADLSPDAIAGAVDEALEWARQPLPEISRRSSAAPRRSHAEQPQPGHGYRAAAGRIRSRRSA